MNNKIRKFTALCLALIVAFTCMPVLAAQEAYAAVKKNPVPSWAKGKIIAHAGGGIAGTSYTNSVEALTATLRKNVKCVEIDFAWTSDHKLVCAHKSTDFRVHKPTEKQFLKRKTSGGYTHMNAATALRMLCKKKNVYMIMDTQESNAPKVYAEIYNILNAAGKTSYMEKIIPQIYKKSQYSKFRKVYKFKSGIFTLYKIKPLTARRLRDIAKYCYKRKLVVTISKGRYNDKRRKILKNSGVVVAVHTINNTSLWKRLFKRGASVVYTDFMF